MNLENLNLVELNAQEVQETVGGTGIFGMLGNLMDAAVSMGIYYIHGVAVTYAQYVTAYPNRS